MPKILSRFAAFSAIACGLGALLFIHTKAPAQGSLPAPSVEVDLLLVLAVDASGSVDRVRFELQKQGYAAAFRHPHVIGAIQSGPRQAIAVAMIQWTGPALQVRVAEWTRIGDAAAASGFAHTIEAAPRALFGGGTSISGAIDAGRALLFESPFKAKRQVIDISGDGANNRGRAVTQARDEAVAAGIGINGLPILALEPDLDRYYTDNVIGGPGAFVIAAESYESFAEAILKKLISEIADIRFQRSAISNQVIKSDGAHARSTNESTTRFSPARSNWMVSLLPSTATTSPVPNFW
jgi:hypothetical protein